jgi:adenine deaminase
MAGLNATGAHLAPTVAELQRMRAVAGGGESGDMIVRGGKVMALHTGEILDRDVVIAGRHIAAITPVGRYDAAREIDASGLFVGPTFIDAHVHIEYTMLTPGEMARLVVPKGTTLLLADPNCIANVLGTRGMDYVGDTGTPLRILRQVSHQVPRSPHLERGGAVVPDDDIASRVQTSFAATLGESNPFALDEASAVKQVAAIAAGKRLTGHTARLGGEVLWSYLAGGITDDHNAVTTDEVLERLRLGCVLTVMAGSMNDNCPSVFADLDALRDGLAHICFCSDDKHVDDLAAQGHIDHHVRQAIAAGVEPTTAWRMASLTAAITYRIDHLVGSVTPGRLADLQLVESMEDPRPTMVFVDGALVAQDGVALFDNTDDIPTWTRDTVRLAPSLSVASFAVRSSSDTDTAWVQAMEMYDGYFKRAFHAALPVVEGAVRCDVERDVLKVAIVDRHHASELVGVGFVRGFGLRCGALAATTNCENQNLVLVGTSDEELLHAARTAEAIGGGYVAVADGDVLATCPLPVAGIMSDQPWEVVRDQSVAVDAAAESLGCAITAPFMIMAFIGLAGVPDLGLTELGLIETATQSFTPVLLGSEAGMLCCRCPSHAHDVHRLMDPASVPDLVAAEER